MWKKNTEVRRISFAQRLECGDSSPLCPRIDLSMRFQKFKDQYANEFLNIYKHKITLKPPRQVESRAKR